MVWKVLNQKKDKKNDRPILKKAKPVIFFFNTVRRCSLKKTETHSNRKYQTANMATAGYSLSLVGKYGVKSIFQSIKRAESHILVGDFVQNMCDEFCRGYVVARVRAAREETAGGPFMDVALTEQIQTLQDLNFRHLLCTFETTEEEDEKFTTLLHWADDMKYLINSVKNSSSKKKKSLPTYPIFVQPVTPI